MKCRWFVDGGVLIVSLPARGAWIEIQKLMVACKYPNVAPRKGSVD